MKNSVLVSILAIASTCAAQFDPEQCGPKAGNQRCKQNKCCSQYGWCGTSNAYCLANLGCQAGFGRCTGVVPSSRASSSSVRSSTAAASPSAPAVLISTNGRCGSSFGGQICKGSTFGDCCSQYNWCGTSTDHCRASQGCQLGFGTCTGVQSSSISVSLSRTSSSRSSTRSISSTRSQGTSSASSRGSSSSTRSSSSSSRASSASSILASSTTFSTRTSLSSSSAGSSSISASQSSQSSSSSPVSGSSSASQASSTSIPLSSSSSSAQPSASSSSSSIAPSSSSSSGVSSSSSAILSSSAIISSSTAVPSSSSLISSPTTSSASPSLSLISSTNSLAASSSASGSPTVVTHVLRAARNPSIDRTSPEHLVPKNALNFYFAEDGTSYTTSIQTTLDSGALGVLLENIASLSSVTCSGSTINLQFSDEASYNTARTWPEGTILFTLSDGCNSATERGVYRLRTTPPATTTTVAPVRRLRARENYWALPLDALLIQMADAVSDYDNLKAAAAAEEAANPKPTPPQISWPPEFTSTAFPDVTSTVSVVAVSSSTAAQPSASPSGLPACGGYAPGGRFDIDGTTYQISCTLSGTFRAIWIDISWHETFRSCMAYCNLNTNCVVATYNEQQINNGKYMCQRWSLLPYKTDPASNAPMAVKVV